MGTDKKIIRCLPNSTKILRALAHRGAKVAYFAHDICKEQLLKSLDSLSHTLAFEENCSTIELHGVVGTYEASFSWLRAQTSFSQQRVVVLWLGNCLAGSADSGVTTLLQSLGAALRHVRPSFCRLVISVDGCKDRDTVSHAYDAPDGTSSAFVSNALTHANRVFAQNTFSSKKWQAMHVYDVITKSSIWGFRARDLRSVTIDQGTVTVGQGEFLEIIQSRKRALPEVVNCVDGTNTEIEDIWAHESVPWGKARKLGHWFIQACALTLYSLVHSWHHRLWRRHWQGKSR